MVLFLESKTIPIRPVEATVATKTEVVEKPEFEVFTKSTISAVAINQATTISAL